MKTKSILIVFSLLLSSQIVHSQAAILALIFGDKVASEEFNLSLEIGGGFTGFQNLENSSYAGVAINFGIAANMKLGESWYFSPTAYFLAKRQTEVNPLNLTTTNPNIDADFQGVPAEINLNYIDVPLIFGYQSPKSNWRFSTGAQLSFRGNTKAYFQVDQGRFEQNYNAYVNNFYWSPLIEVAYELPAIRNGKGAFVRMRYTHGMGDTFTEEFSQMNISTNAVTLMLSFPFLTDELAAKNREKLKHQ